MWGVDSWAMIGSWVSAAVTGVLTWKLVTIERGRDRQTARLHDLTVRATEQALQAQEIQREAAERAQADLVHAWAQEDPDRPGEWIVVVQNSSPSPIFGVRLGVLRGRLTAESENVHRFSPSADPSVSVEYPPAFVCRPGESRIPCHTQILEGEVVQLISFAFYDTRDKRWLRTGVGALYPYPYQ